MPIDAIAASKKWSSRVTAAANDGTIARGIDAVTVAPGQAAARQKDVWAANTASAKDRWAAATAAVTKESWQASMKGKGISRMAEGATDAEGKMATFLGKLGPVIDQAKASLPPRGNFQQNLQRATAMATALHNAKGSFKS